MNPLPRQDHPAAGSRSDLPRVVPGSNVAPKVELRTHNTTAGSRSDLPRVVPGSSVAPEVVFTPPIVVRTPRPTYTYVPSPVVMSRAGRYTCISLGPIALISGIALLILGIVFVNPAAISCGALLTIASAITTGIGARARVH